MEDNQEFTEEDVIYFKKVFNEFLKHLVPKVSEETIELMNYPHLKEGGLLAPSIK